MLLRETPGPLRLTYCSNVHPAETAEEVIDLALDFWPRLTRALAARHGGKSFAQGLWLSAAAADAFVADGFLTEALGDALITARSHAPTANIFPYGGFHEPRVKERVYRPDWGDEERLRYSLAAADCLTQLPAEGSYQSLSTVPGSFKSFPDLDRAAIARNIGRAVAGLHILEMETERRVVLAFEPEPGCLFESLDDWLDFFREELLGTRLEALEALKPGNREMQEHLVRRHIGLCYDCCHQALAFEEPKSSFDRIAAAGCEVAKIQLSSALEIEAPGTNREARERLAAFAEPRYLHQVSALRPDGELDRFTDLPEFLARAEGSSWLRARIHFHVPIHAATFGPLGTTQTQLEGVLAELRRRPITELAEIETYSWSVMPGREGEAAGDDRLLEDILAEYAFVIERLR